MGPWEKRGPAAQGSGGALGDSLCFLFAQDGVRGHTNPGMP